MQTMYSCGCMYHMGKPPASIGGEQEISNRGRGQSPSDKRSARMRRDSAAQLISPHMRLNLVDQRHMPDKSKTPLQANLLRIFVLIRRMAKKLPTVYGKHKTYL